MCDISSHPLLELQVDCASDDRLRLCRLGEAINYKAYGDDWSEVWVAPALLYRVMARYRDPRDMLAHEGIARAIDTRPHADLRQALAWSLHWQDARGSVFMLPDAAWSERVRGCLANELAGAQPQHVHAVLKLQGTGKYVAARAPPTSTACWRTISSASSRDLPTRVAVIRLPFAHDDGLSGKCAMNQLPASYVTRSRAPRSSNRWVAPGTMASSLWSVSWLSARRLSTETFVAAPTRGRALPARSGRPPRETTSNTRSGQAAAATSAAAAPEPGLQGPVTSLVAAVGSRDDR